MDFKNFTEDVLSQENHQPIGEGEINQKTEYIFDPETGQTSFDYWHQLDDGSFIMFYHVPSPVPFS